MACCTPRTVHNGIVEFENTGDFADSLQGKHTKLKWVLDEDRQEELREWIREHAAAQGKPRMRLTDFMDHINKTILPEICPGCTVCEETARLWLHRLGFKRFCVKTGAYKDGHERPDNVEDRVRFAQWILQLDDYHAEALPAIDIPEDKLQAIRTIAMNASPISSAKPILYCFGDEAIFHANDDDRFVWASAENPQLPLPKKSEGAGIMVLDFMLSTGKYVELTEEEFQRAKLEYPDVFTGEDTRLGAFFLQYGKNRDGYLDSDSFLREVRKVLTILKFKYPGIRFAFILDRSSVHVRYSDSALLTSKMNLRPGGKQPKLRTTQYTKDGKVHEQVMVFPDDHPEFPGQPKGLLQVCLERGLANEGQKMLKDELAALLKAEPDFKHERSLLHELVEDDFGFILLLLPKFHPELNAIEYVWASQKRFARKNCKHNVKGLSKLVREARSSITGENMRNCFYHARQWAYAYLTKPDGFQAQQLVKLYSSHRRVTKKDVASK